MTSVTVTIPLTIRRRGGRKQIIGPDGAQVRDDGAGVATTRGDPALVKALARGFRWRRMLEEGRYASIRELAAAEGVDRSYVGRVLNLTLMRPDLVQKVLDADARTDIMLTGAINLVKDEWSRQMIHAQPTEPDPRTRSCA